jgi:hypothetical protein
VTGGVVPCTISGAALNRLAGSARGAISDVDCLPVLCEFRRVCVHTGPPGSRNILSAAACDTRWFLGLQLARILVALGNVVPPIGFVFGQIFLVVPNILFGRVDLFLLLPSEGIVFFSGFQVAVLNGAFLLPEIRVAFSTLFLELGLVGLKVRLIAPNVTVIAANITIVLFHPLHCFAVLRKWSGVASKRDECCDSAHECQALHRYLPLVCRASDVRML